MGEGYRTGLATLLRRRRRRWRRRPERGVRPAGGELRARGREAPDGPSGGRLASGGGRSVACFRGRCAACAGGVALARWRGCGARAAGASTWASTARQSSMTVMRSVACRIVCGLAQPRRHDVLALAHKADHKPAHFRPISDIARTLHKVQTQRTAFTRPHKFTGLRRALPERRTSGQAHGGLARPARFDHRRRGRGRGRGDAGRGSRGGPAQGAGEHMAPVRGLDVVARGQGRAGRADAADPDLDHQHAGRVAHGLPLRGAHRAARRQRRARHLALPANV